MSKVVLTPDILQSVSKPGRYTGNEWNQVVKEHGSVDCTFALSLPDVYEVGMSNLGLKIIYEVLNNRKDTAAERVYAPWTDMEEKMREKNIPLFSLESKTPIKEFDFLGFSVQYEMIYTNIINMLDLSGIAVWTKEREENDPFIVGGGPCVYNTEPLADFFDFFIVGEGEEVIGEVAEAFIRWKKAGKPGGRAEYLRIVGAIPGIYVPSLYIETRDENDRFCSLKPMDSTVPAIVNKRVIADMDSVEFHEKPVVPYLDIVHNRIMLELFRGCTRGCRFCQAGIAYRPVRERSMERLKTLARKLVDSTGYSEMSLTSLSSADYSCLRPLVEEFIATLGKEKISFSLPSLRIDSFSVDLAEKLQEVRKSSLTFAPEAGTQRMRDVINKGVTEDDLIKSLSAAYRQGWKSVKLYFMMGLPTETDEDIIGIAKLAKRAVDLYQEIKGRRGVKVTISVSCFVPKPFTPFQWFGQNTMEEFHRKQQLLKEHITDKSIRYTYHEAKVSLLEGVLARGDRKLSRLIYEAWKAGAKFDGWTDLFNDEAWQKAFAVTGIDANEYNTRTRDFDEPLPWEHTTPGVDKSFLLREYKKAIEGKLTGDCRRGPCNACGICPNLGVDVIDWGTKK
ncbi:MAG: TIGR03960 family B12-binding radical SAM protein [Selenomonadaceae bacterium]|nr:TIGR03960 family B12-binding radical SAM protein [Selenomonadaceae bacterium]